MATINLRNVSDELHQLIHRAAQDEFFKQKTAGKIDKGQKVSIVRWILQACEDRLRRDGYLG